mmetsp:Transcript_116263/g.183822  ORF Transcript_116263/g.183822 Transcript_116263/m.183822 type:complete len:220 (+) Transcript_116263:107-766(+)
MAGAPIAAIGGVRRGMRRGGQVPVRHGDSSSEKLARAKRERREKQKALMQKLVGVYDADKSGRLDASELSKLLRDYTQATFETTDEPSKEDMEFILFMCDADNSGGIDCDELGKAIEIWLSFLEQRPKMQELFKKYDADGTLDIDETELRGMLAELNNGVPATSDTVDWIMAMADVSGDGTLSADELTRAVATWYTNVGEAPTPTTCKSPPSSKACLIL